MRQQQHDAAPAKLDGPAKFLQQLERVPGKHCNDELNEHEHQHEPKHEHTSHRKHQQREHVELRELGRDDERRRWVQ